MTHPTQTARGRLLNAFDELAGTGHPIQDKVRASFRKQLDAYAHELAEQIRTWADQVERGEEAVYGFATYETTLATEAVSKAADLIDPEAKG